MITREELDHLALLARLEVPEGEKAKLQKDLESILSYVSEIKKVQDAALALQNLGEGGPEYHLTNVLRPDADPIPPGAFPLMEGHLEVKKIL